MSDTRRVRLAEGKAPPELLFDALGEAAEGLLQGPGPGRDASVMAIGGRALVAAADPISFNGAEAVRLAVTINANDVYALGAEPRWFLATVLAPPGTTESELSALLRALRESCDAAGVALAGGHTEISDAVSRTVVSGCMLGEASLDRIVPSDGAQDGDVIVQAGAAAVEGTALLAQERSNRLRASGWSRDEIAAAAALADDPGISIATAARTLASIGAAGGVHAMHDVTEGGIATAAAELAEAAGLGVELRGDDVLWHEATRRLCDDLDLDPLGLLGSGTLLAAAAPSGAAGALSALARAGVDGALIGRVRTESGAILAFRDATRPLPRFATDEALRALADASPD